MNHTGMGRQIIIINRLTHILLPRTENPFFLAIALFFHKLTSSFRSVVGIEVKSSDDADLSPS